MKRKSYFLGLATVFVLVSGCGKSLHMTKAGQLQADQAAQDQAQKLKAQDQARLQKEGKTILELPSDGTLSAYSDLDLTEVKELPYLNTDEGVNATVDVGHPAYAKKFKDLKFVKRSNLVFRSVIKLPNPEAIQEVKSITLKLQGLRLYSNTEELTTASLSKQMLCMIEKRVCSGEIQDDAKNKNGTWTAINDLFSKKVELAPEVTLEESDLSVAKIFSLPAVKSEEKEEVKEETKEESKESNASKKLAKKNEEKKLSEVSLDLMEIFGIESKDAVQWIYDHSVEYAPGYRKFRMVIGNNLYVESGALSIEIGKVDKSKLVRDFDQLAPKPLKANDAVRTLLISNASTEVALKHDVSEAIEESDIVLDEKTNGFAKGMLEPLKVISDVLVKHESKIEKVRIVGKYDLAQKGKVKLADEQAKALARKFAAVIVHEKIKNKLMVGAYAPKGQSSCDPTLECAKDRGILIQVNMNPDLSEAEKEPIVKEIVEAIKGLYVSRS